MACMVPNSFHEEVSVTQLNLSLHISVKNASRLGFGLDIQEKSFQPFEVQIAV